MNTQNISRREWIAATAAAAGTSFLPSNLLGKGPAPPSERLNIAVIGAGGRGAVDLQHLAGQTIVALCDVDWRTESHSQFPAGKVAAGYPSAKRYDDYRKMLEEMDKSIDAVVVSCPDHSHAHASILAMSMGKHVYCEKPMAHDIFEVNAMVAAEREYKVTTQVGHQGHGSDDVRSMVEWLRDGAIGTVREVHIFEGTGRAGRTPWYYGQEALNQGEPIPRELNWDLWLGPAASRPYRSAYLPLSWRRWLDFGTGMLGDFNSHYLDPVVWGLDLGLPNTIEVETEPEYDPRINKQTFPHWFVARFGFDSTGKRAAVNVTWYGNSPHRPPRPDGWKPDDKLPDETGGGIIVGTRGAILYGKIFHSFGDRPTPGVVRLFPDELDKSYKRPDKTIPRVANHWMEWVECCKVRKPGSAHFAWSQTLSKIALLGNIGIRNTGKLMHLDPKEEQFINDDEANLSLLRRPYRAGWPLPA